MLASLAEVGSTLCQSFGEVLAEVQLPSWDLLPSETRLHDLLFPHAEAEDHQVVEVDDMIGTVAVQVEAVV